MLVANVEEARYDVLVAEDGKRLVRARYAVRNNQRAFLALTLPPQSVLWSALLAGQPVRPGLSAEGAYLLPLQKGRTGENAPTFAVELVYLQRATAWDVKGNARVELPAVDLPVSRTGLLVHYSPRFEVEPKSGAFRPETDPGPWSAALRAEMTGISAGTPARRRQRPRPPRSLAATRQALAGSWSASARIWGRPPPASCRCKSHYLTSVHRSSSPRSSRPNRRRRRSTSPTNGPQRF